MKILYGQTTTKQKEVMKVINRSILFMKRVYKGSTLSQKTVFETIAEVKHSILNTPVIQDNVIPLKLMKRREKNKLKRREKNKLKRLNNKLKKKKSSDINTAISTELTTHQNEQPSTVKPPVRTIVPYKDIERCSTSSTMCLTSSTPSHPIVPDTTAENETSNPDTFQPEIKIECEGQNDTPEPQIILSLTDIMSEEFCSL